MRSNGIMNVNAWTILINKLLVALFTHQIFIEHILFSEYCGIVENYYHIDLVLREFII